MFLFSNFVGLVSFETGNHKTNYDYTHEHIYKSMCIQTYMHTQVHTHIHICATPPPCADSFPSLQGDNTAFLQETDLQETDFLGEEEKRQTLSNFRDLTLPISSFPSFWDLTFQIQNFPAFQLSTVQLPNFPTFQLSHIPTFQLFSA